MSLALAADENFDGDILRGILRQHPGLDIVRIVDVGLSGADDARVLEWAAQEGRVLLTHDVKTMPRHAYERVDEGALMPGVVVIPAMLPLADAIGDIVLLALAAHAEECARQVRFLPLQ